MNFNECVFYANSYNILENVIINENDIISINEISKPVIVETPVTQVVSITVSYELSIGNNMIEQIIIKNLIDNNNYLNEYVSFLLGAYDDNEFKEVSKKYIKTYDDSSIQDMDIAYSINLLRNIIGNDINPDLILTVLNISPKRIEQKKKKLLDVK
jgi:hypothetical protein